MLIGSLSFMAFWHTFHVWPLLTDTGSGEEAD